MVASRNTYLSGALALALTVAGAQQDAFTRGRTLFAEKKYDEAVAALDDAVRTDAKNGIAWFWLGVSRHYAGHYEEALTALLKADEMNVFPPFTKYALARSYAATKQYEKALVWLGHAADEGYANRAQLESESLFDQVRDRPEMKTVLRTIGKNVNPAEFDPRYRQLDFWIGEWNVYDQGGNLQGTNTITKEIGGAVLIERWTNAAGSTGMSINFFDPGSGTFKQQWVDQTGYNTAYEGGLVGKAMVLVGTTADIKGAVSKNRMTFTPNPDGTVTQFIEDWNESTKTWTQSFLGTYKRKQME